MVAMLGQLAAAVAAWTRSRWAAASGVIFRTVPQAVNTEALAGAGFSALPWPQCCGGGCIEQRDPFFPSLAVPDHVCARPAGRDVGPGERRDLGDPRPAGDHDQHQQVVAAPGPGAAVRAGEEHLHLGLAQVGDGLLACLFRRVASIRAIDPTCSRWCGAAWRNGEWIAASRRLWVWVLLCRVCSSTARKPPTISAARSAASRSLGWMPVRYGHTRRAAGGCSVGGDGVGARASHVQAPRSVSGTADWQSARGNARRMDILSVAHFECLPN